MHVAFATSAAYSRLTPDDRLAAEACDAHGIRVTPAVWDDPHAPWTDYDAIVIRSTWDYHRRPAEFTDWLARIESMGARVWNPVPLLRWNANKRYLAELASRGVAIVPGMLLPLREASALGDVMDRHGWNDVVIKPTISATAYGTHRVLRADASRVARDFAELPASTDILVQPFLREIESVGEWSLVYFSGRFSHSVRKRPARGDFRVQTEYGGSSVAEQAPAAVIEAGAAVLRAVEGPWLYARVDGIETANGFRLMELEMLEPLLFFELAPGSPERFAAALHDQLR